MRPSILMLHGFSAHKDTWLTVVKVRLTLDIAFYFPIAHGANTQLKTSFCQRNAECMLLVRHLSSGVMLHQSHDPRERLEFILI